MGMTIYSNYIQNKSGLVKTNICIHECRIIAENNIPHIVLSYQIKYTNKNNTENVQHLYFSFCQVHSFSVGSLEGIKTDLIKCISTELVKKTLIMMYVYFV